MAKNPSWYSGAFILVTVAESRDGYQHPRVSVCKQYEGTPETERHVNDPRLPARDLYDHPTRNAETLLAFEFQQNVPGIGDLNHVAEPWLKISDQRTSGAYAGRLDTAIRVESWGIDTRDVSSKLASVDRALKALREKVRELGAKQTECDATALVMALKLAFKLPVLFVVYRAAGRKPFAEINPDYSLDTNVLLREVDRRTDEAAARGETH